MGLRDSPVALCGHTGWLVLYSIVSDDPSNTPASLTDLGKHASGNSSRQSVSRRGAILDDIGTDATDWERAPRKIFTSGKNILDIGIWLGGKEEISVQPLQADPDDPPLAQPSTCAVNSTKRHWTCSRPRLLLTTTGPAK